MTDDSHTPTSVADRAASLAQSLLSLETVPAGEFFAKVAQEISSLLAVGLVAVTEALPRGREGRILAVGPRDSSLLKLTFSTEDPGFGPPGQAHRWTADSASEPREVHPLAALLQARSLVTVPLVAPDREVLGWLSVGEKRRSRLPPHTESVLQAFAGRTVVEIRHRRQVERLTLERDRYRSFFEGDFLGTYMTSLDGEMIDCNLTFAKILGYESVEEVKAVRSVEHYGSPLDREKAIDRIRRDGRVARFRSRLRRRDGSLADVISYGHGRYDSSGELRGFAGFILQDSDQQRFHDRILEQSALLDKMAEAVIVCRPDRRVKSWNSKAGSLFSFPRDQDLGVDFKELLGPILDVDLEEAWAELLETDHWSGEFRIAPLRRPEKIVRSRWSLLRDAGGRPRSILMVATDITETRAIEASFYRTQRLESLGTLAGGIAHDLNNVLTPILLSADLLKQSIEDPKDRHLLQSMAATARRGKDMVKQILWFARGTGGKRVPFLLNRVLEELQRVLHHTLPRSIEVESRIATEPIQILGDATQIFQAFMNLCLNARDAMPSGGHLRLEASLSPPPSDSPMETIGGTSGKTVLLEVADTGCGIPAEEVEKIFEPFFSTKRSGSGTGLGLTTANSIIRSHGGYIVVRSRPRRGTVFRILLPALETSASEDLKEEEELSPHSGDHRTILVADDDADVLELTSATLEAHGYRVLQAQDGPEALEIFAEKSQEISGVLCDQDMPIMDGLRTLRAMSKIAPNVGLLLITGLPGFTPALNTIDVLRKPWSPGELLQAVSRLLGDGEPSAGVTLALQDKGRST